MLGNKDLRNNEAVTGQEIGDGLAESGRPVPRVDRVMEKALVSASAEKRDTAIHAISAYESGIVKALNVAKAPIEHLPLILRY